MDLFKTLRKNNKRKVEAIKFYVYIETLKLEV